MVYLTVIDEDSGEKRTVEFSSSGTYYDLARTIRDKGKFQLPKYFKLLTNGKSLKADQKEELYFTEGQTIKIRDSQALENFGLINITDVTNGCTDYLDISDTAPDWRTVDNGINLFGYCENKDCKAFEKEVIEMIKENEFDICKIQGIMHCPMCKCPVKVGTIGFYNCYFNFYGSKYDRENDELEKFGKQIKNFETVKVSSDDTVVVNGEKITVSKTKPNKTTYFNDKNGKADFAKLVLQVQNFHK